MSGPRLIPTAATASSKLNDGDEDDAPRLIPATSASSASSMESRSMLMDDVMSRLETNQDDAAALLKRINSLLGLNDETVHEIVTNTPRSREHSPVRTVSAPDVALPRLRLTAQQPSQSAVATTLVPVTSPTTIPASRQENQSSLKCGWFACWSMDGEN